MTRGGTSCICGGEEVCLSGVWWGLAVFVWDLYVVRHGVPVHPVSCLVPCVLTLERWQYSPSSIGPIIAKYCSRGPGHLRDWDYSTTGVEWTNRHWTKWKICCWTRLHQYEGYEHMIWSTARKTMLLVDFCVQGCRVDANGRKKAAGNGCREICVQHLFHILFQLL